MTKSDRFMNVVAIVWLVCAVCTAATLGVLLSGWRPFLVDVPEEQIFEIPAEPVNDLRPLEQRDFRDLPEEIVVAQESEPQRRARQEAEIEACIKASPPKRFRTIGCWYKVNQPEIDRRRAAREATR